MDGLHCRNNAKLCETWYIIRVEMLRLANRALWLYIALAGALLGVMAKGFGWI